MIANRDQLLVDKTKERPAFRCWRPHSVDFLQVDNTSGYNTYEEFQDIVRTVHFDEYKDIHRIQQLTPNPLTESTCTHLLHRFPDMKGLWFGISDPNFDDEHNWCGNVNFDVNLESFLKSLEIYNVYFVEVIEFPSTSTSRLLITTQKFDLPQYDPTVKGGPWYRDPSGKNWFLNDVRRYDGATNVYGHQVQFFLVLSDCKAASLLNMLMVKAVNHSQANCGTRYQCMKHRSDVVGVWRDCPYPWSKERTRSVLAEMKLPRLTIVEKDTDQLESDERSPQR